MEGGAPRSCTQGCSVPCVDGAEEEWAGVGVSLGAAVGGPGPSRRTQLREDRRGLRQERALSGLDAGQCSQWEVRAGWTAGEWGHPPHAAAPWGQGTAVSGSQP